MRVNPAYGSAVVWLAVAFSAGSCGYHLAGRADTVPDTVHTIAIPTFRNNTTEFKIELVNQNDIADRQSN